MFWSGKIRTVIALILAASTPSQQLFGMSVRQEPRARDIRTKVDYAAAREVIYRRLVEAHWTPKTGLFRGFPDTNDLKLSQQASTYEQAAMGLLAIHFGDLKRAKPLLQFFKTAWETGPDHDGSRTVCVA